MIQMMQTYGSEVSDSVMPIGRKTHIQKASIVRQFRRWNPNFLQHFHHVHGKWVPKLGQEGELARRRQARLDKHHHKRNNNNSPSATAGASTAAAVAAATVVMQPAARASSTSAAAATGGTIFPSANKVTRKKAKKGLV